MPVVEHKTAALLTIRIDTTSTLGDGLRPRKIYRRLNVDPCQARPANLRCAPPAARSPRETPGQRGHPLPEGPWLAKRVRSHASE